MTRETMHRLARAALPAAFVLLALLLAAFVSRSGGDARLYWEYGGRLLGHSYVPNYVEWVQHGVGTQDGLDHAAPGARLAPYTDFAAEYPPGALLLFEALRSIVDEPIRYGFAFAVLMAAGVVLIGACALRLRTLIGGEGPLDRLAALALLVAWPVLVGRAFLLGRFDMVPAALTLAALLLHGRGRPGWAGLLLGLGGAVKLWPLLAAPLLMTDLATRRDWRGALLVAIAGAAGFVLPHLAMLAQGTAPGDLLVYLTYLRDRPAELESLVANLRMFGGTDGLGVARDFGSINLLFAGDRGWIAAAGIVNALLLLLVYGAFALAMAKVADPARRLRLAVAAAGAIAVTMVACSRVYSGEYIIWFFPFVLVLAGARRGWFAGLAYVAVCMLLREMYHHWEGLNALEGTAIAALTAKNLATLATGAACLAPLLRAAAGGRGLEPGAAARDIAAIREGPIAS